MKPNKNIQIIIAFIIIITVVILWSWYKDNWWLLLGIPFALFFFSNAQTVGHSLGYVITFVIGHILFTLLTGHFQFTVWSWYFFFCGLMSYSAACIIFGTEQSNWEKEAKKNGDFRSFEEFQKDKFLNSPEIKEMTEKILNKHK